MGDVDSWMRQYILFHNKQHPKDMGEREIEQFLTSLALDRNVAASTQNQAFNAILFLYREVLNIELDEIDSFRADFSLLQGCLSILDPAKDGYDRSVQKSVAKSVGQITIVKHVTPHVFSYPNLNKIQTFFKYD
jgi:hypothetical protein